MSPGVAAPSVASAEQRCEALARRQRRLLTRDDLRRAGCSEDRIKHWIRTGQLRRVHRGIYAYRQAELDQRAGFLAATLACGPRAALFGLSAAVLWDWLPARPGPVHVAITGPHCRGPRGVHLHRVKEIGLTTRHGIRVTTPHQTVLDLAARAPDRELAVAVNEALLRRQLGPDALLASIGKRPGARRLRHLLADGPTPTRSEAERRLLRLIARAGLPRPLTNTRAAGHEVYVLCPHHRVVLEMDGYAFHALRPAFERDRRRDQTLRAAGYEVVRTTWRQLTREPLSLAAHLGATLASTSPTRLPMRPA